MEYYVVHTYTGHEQKVKKILERAIKEKQLETKFGRIVIPTQNVVKIRKGKKVIEEKRLYPGYIVVEMEADNDTLRLVNSLSGVTHFLGSKSKPIPLAESEVAGLLEQVEKSKEKVVASIPFAPGERVKVIDGPFTDFIGTVDEVYEDREKVKVMVAIFGRSTPVELSFQQIKSF